MISSQYYNMYNLALYDFMSHSLMHFI